MTAWFETSRGPVRHYEIHRSKALDEWRRLRTDFAQTRQWPVIVDGESSPQSGLRGQSLDVEEALRDSAGIDAARWLSNQQAEYALCLEEYSEEGQDLAFDAGDLVAERKPPLAGQISILHGRYDFVNIALVPAREPWEVPALLRFGDWNDCPADEVHCSILRHWHERFGAEPIVVTSDVIELLVTHPIADRETAKQVAIEQYAYAPDIVEQGTGTVKALAQSLLNSQVWFFWWD